MFGWTVEGHPRSQCLVQCFVTWDLECWGNQGVFWHDGLIFISHGASWGNACELVVVDCLRNVMGVIDNYIKSPT